MNASRRNPRLPANRYIIILLVLALSLAVRVRAQTYTVLHSFSGGQDGASPVAGLTMDRAGNLYGTTPTGGYMGGVCAPWGGCGTVFRLSPKNDSWVFTPLYEFQGDSDGQGPQAAVTIGPDGAVYGTTEFGGADQCSIGYDCGTVFKLTPPPSACHAALCPWTETVIYDFPAQAPHGIGTPIGGLIFDEAGNIYGTAFVGGLGVCAQACGVVYELVPDGSERRLIPLYEFAGGLDGGSPTSTLLRDQQGNLYGTASYAGRWQMGTAFELVRSGQSWIFKLLYTFTGEDDGGMPTSGLVMDAAGNLYGDTPSGGVNNGGVVFQLAPAGTGWNYSVLDSLVGGINGPVTLDNAGNLYALAGGGNQNEGLLFELVPGNGGWTEVDLHSFGTPRDGATPYGGVALANSGNLFGTTAYGGASQLGVVWQLAR
jgi:uncharacterized repeat protein (TIGR03803 family)